MTITFVGVGSASAKNNASVTPGLPSGLLTGDLMLCFASARGNGILSVDPLDQAGMPTQWLTKWQLSHASSGINKIALFYRFYVDGDAGPIIKYAGGASGHTVIAQVCAFRSVNQSSPFDVQGATSSNASQANIGPISGITTGANGKCVIVFGHRADDWSLVDTLSGDGLMWNELGEPKSTLGNDAGEVWDYTISALGSVTITAKTFTVIGGVANYGMGVMQSLNEVVVLTGWRKLQYLTEPPTSGQFNKLKFASEPPVPSSWNKLLYDGE